MNTLHGVYLTTALTLEINEPMSAVHSFASWIAATLRLPRVVIKHTSFTFK